VVCGGRIYLLDPLAIDVWVYVWIFYSDPLVFLSVFVPIPCCFYYYGFVTSLRSGIVMPPALDFVLRIAFNSLSRTENLVGCWWLMSVILAIKRQRSRGLQFEASPRQINNS
jgi:hypothetical protein